MPQAGRAGTLVAASAGLVAALAAGPAWAFKPERALPEFSGQALNLGWGVPFTGLILSIALVPLFAPNFWHRHFGKVAALWALAFLAPFVAVFGAAQALHHVVHIILLEYLPFLVVLFALFTVAGGICARGELPATPVRNTGLLALGTLLASVMGTAGASMLLIRPLLSANQTRRRKVHLVVFFIILVGNIGGALSPLGDPPLFIGFLKGVDFFWTLRHLAAPTAFLAAVLLAVFHVLDTMLARRESGPRPAPRRPLGVEGKRNFPLLAGVIGAVLLSGLWDPGLSIDVLDTPVELQNLARDAILIALALVSLAITPRSVRAHNAFTWAPMLEVGKLFAAIFLTMIPVLAILQAGRDGALAGMIALLTDRTSGQPHDAMVFWTAGVLSAFLDNAPTYLVFFNLAGGDAEQLMTAFKTTLRAISAAAVYFGALTYVGNAPNFMIKAIAEDLGVAMPSFFGYLAYAGALLLPLFALIALAFL